MRIGHSTSGQSAAVITTSSASAFLFGGTYARSQAISASARARAYAYGRSGHLQLRRYPFRLRREWNLQQRAHSLQRLSSRLSLARMAYPALDVVTATHVSIFPAKEFARLLRVAVGIPTVVVDRTQLSEPNAAAALGNTRATTAPCVLCTNKALAIQTKAWHGCNTEGR